MCLLRYLHWLPIVMVGLGILKIISTYIIAIANEYVDPVFPYISTVASGNPQRVTFLLLALILSLLLLACVCTRYVFVKKVTYKRRQDAEDGALSPPVSSISEALTSGDSCVGFTAAGSSSVEVHTTSSRTRKHDAYSKSSWYRLNTVTFITGMVVTVCYAGVCVVPENVKSLRLTHMLLAITLFFSGTAYVIFDCTLSYWLLKLASSSHIKRHPELEIRHWVVAKRATVLVRLVIVVFTLVLSVAGLPLLYFADDPLEHYYGDITKPKLRCAEQEPTLHNATTGSTSIYAQSTSRSCNFEMHVIIHIITAIIEWLVTVAIMAYFLTFFSEFKNFRPVVNIVSKKQQRLDGQTGAGGERSSTLTENFSRTTQATSLPSPLYSPSLSQFSYDSSENSPMINIVCVENKS